VQPAVTGTRYARRTHQRKENQGSAVRVPGATLGGGVGGGGGGFRQSLNDNYLRIIL